MKRWWPLLVFLPLILTACGDDGSSPESLAPRISNLRFSPEYVYVTDFTGEGITIAGTIDFTDADGDLAVLHLKTSAGADLDVPLDATAGLTSGVLVGTFILPPVMVGEYELQVWVEDKAHHRSNTLTATFGVRIDGSGTAWHTRPSGTTVQLNRVAAGSGGWWAVGYGGTILRSADGLDWSSCDSGTSATLWGAAWSGSVHLAVGEGGAVCTSPDGVNWNAAVYSAAPADFYAVAWSGSVFVVVGDIGASGPTQVLTSSDGVAWDSWPVTADVRELRAVTWADTRFVALGSTGNDSTVVASSPDGRTWSLDARLEPIYPRDVCWSGSRFVAAGASGSLPASIDGVTWNVVDSGSPAMTGVAWSGSHFVAVGVGISGSTDGAVWVQRSDEQLLRSVVWAGDRYIAVGAAGTIMTSP